MAERDATTAESQKDKGMTIFLDVFRRADKNDDGFISWDEFVSYFADGVMSKDELQTLFNEIDSHNTNNIDTGELCAYFSEHLGNFKDIFGIIEMLNRKITNVLYSTSQAYQDSDRTQRFITRFLMREIINQMSALQRPLEAASDSLDIQAMEERSDIKPMELGDTLKKSSSGVIVPGRIVRRAKRQISAPPNLAPEGNTFLNSQIDKLVGLIDRLESKINFESFRDEEVIAGPEDTLILAQREFILKESSGQDFNAQLRAYVDVTQGFKGCLNISVRDFRDLRKFTVYEMWTSEEKFQSNTECDDFKTLIEKTSDMVEKPVTASTMKIPATWWK